MVQSGAVEARLERAHGGVIFHRRLGFGDEGCSRAMRTCQGAMQGVAPTANLPCAGSFGLARIVQHSLHEARTMSEQSGKPGDGDEETLGMPVLGCIDGSAAAIAGVRRGDRLLEVNGMRVHDANSYITARNLEPDLMHVVLRREGELVKLTLHFESYTRKLLSKLALN